MSAAEQSSAKITSASEKRGETPAREGRKRKGSVLKTVLALVLCGGAAVGAARLFSSPQPQSTAPAPAPVPVVTSAVQRQDVPTSLKGLGSVQAFNTATIRSQVTGLLEKVDFVEGQFVKQGAVLAQLDPRIYQANLEKAQAQLARDQAELTNVKTNLGRYEPLLKRGFATDQQVTDQQAKTSQLENTLKSDQAAIDYAQTELGYATLKAPFAGVTGVRMIDIGNIIRPTDANGIVVLTQLQPISVIFTLPTNDIPAVQTALAKGTVEAVVYDQSGKTKLDTGTLLLINNQASQTSGTVQLKATFPNQNRQLWPGAFVNAEVVTSVVKGALTIPTNAIQQNDEGQYVYVVNGNKVAVRPVQVTQRERGVALIGEGLAPGETVVVQGQYRLTPGAVVVATAPSGVPNTSAASSGMLP